MHDTKSEIFAIETRSESAILHDTSDGKQFLFINYVRKHQVRDEIAESLMKQAGDFYAKGDLKNAEQYRNFAEIVKRTAVSPDYQPRSFEADYEWLKEMVKFINENNILPK